MSRGELDEIGVTFDEDVLNIAAEHEDDQRPAEAVPPSLPVPKDVDEDDITARDDNDILEVPLPVSREATVTGTETLVEG